MSDTTRRLWGLSTSPWTAKASFALDYAGVPYEFREHTPMLGEGRLRRLAGTKPASVPLLEDPTGPVMGSLAIARWADAHTTKQLFPAALVDDVLAWDARSETLLNAARILLFERLSTSPEAQKESVPTFVPKPLRGAMRFAARQGIQFLARKYALPEGGGAELLATVVGELEELRRAVAAAGERGTLLATFSHADITMAAALNGFSPTNAEARTADMGPGFRAAWTRTELVERFPDLFAWRDRIYAEYRTA